MADRTLHFSNFESGPIASSITGHEAEPVDVITARLPDGVRAFLVHSVHPPRLLPRLLCCTRLDRPFYTPYRLSGEPLFRCSLIPSSVPLSSTPQRRGASAPSSSRENKPTHRPGLKIDFTFAGRTRVRDQFLAVRRRSESPLLTHSYGASNPLLVCSGSQPGRSTGSSLTNSQNPCPHLAVALQERRTARAHRENTQDRGASYRLRAPSRARSPLTPYVIRPTSRAVLFDPLSRSLSPPSTPVW